MAFLYEQNETSNSMYFAGDGSYGDAGNLVVVDLNAVKDLHFIDQLEQLDWSEEAYPDFVRWAVKNPHEPVRDSGDLECAVCINHNIDEPEQTVGEILAKLEQVD